MAEDQNIGTVRFEHLLRGAIKLVQLAEDVTDQHTLAVQLFEAFCRISSKPIVVAFDGEDRRDGFQAMNDGEFADVAGMNDGVHTGEDAGYRLVVQPMRV